MKLPISKYFAWSCVIVASIATGALLSVLGLAICDHNVGGHGASYSAYQYEWLALPAAPGMIVAEAREGSDFRLGEIQYHRASAIGWNMLIYGAAGFVALFARQFFIRENHGGYRHSNKQQVEQK